MAIASGGGERSGIMTRNTMDEDWDERRDGEPDVPEYELRDFAKILLRNGKEHTSYYHYTNWVAFGKMMEEVKVGPSTYSSDAIKYVGGSRAPYQPIRPAVNNDYCDERTWRSARSSPRSALTSRSSCSWQGERCSWRSNESFWCRAILGVEGVRNGIR